MTGWRKKTLPCEGKLSMSIKPNASASEPAGRAFTPGHFRGKKDGTWGCPTIYADNP